MPSSCLERRCCLHPFLWTTACACHSDLPISAVVGPSLQPPAGFSRTPHCQSTSFVPVQSRVHDHGQHLGMCWLHASTPLTSSSNPDSKHPKEPATQLSCSCCSANCNPKSSPALPTPTTAASSLPTDHHHSSPP